MWNSSDNDVAPGTVASPWKSLGAPVALMLLVTLAFAPLPAAAQQGRRAVQIGVADGAPAELFAVISDIAVGSDGGVFVLDMMQQELRSFDADGRHRATVGRKGRGPGEFLQPNALTITDDGLVHVVDNPNTRIATFRPTASSLEHVGDVRLPFPVDGICAIGRRRFVMSIGQPRLIHELDDKGAVVRSFATAEPPDPALGRIAPGARRMLEEYENQGRLACDAASESVLMLHSATFVVRAFSVDGRSLWRVRLVDVQPSEVKAVRGGAGIQIGPNVKTGVHSSASGLAMDANGAVLVTIASMKVERGTRRLEYQERRLQLSDGAEIGRTDARGVIHGVRGGRRYATDGEPFPRVLIY